MCRSFTGCCARWRAGGATRADCLRIRRSDRHPADYAWLPAAEQTQRRARGYKALPSRFVTGWQSVAPRGIRVWEARKEGRPVAAMLFVLHPPHASYHIGWAGDRGRASHAHNLILWQAMGALASEGITALDLGLVETDAAPGLARFKIGAGAQVRLLGAMLLVPPFAPLLSRHPTQSPANSLR